MSLLSAAQLRELMRACVGRDEAAALDHHDLLTATFEDLDFDSLAQVELAERLRERYGIALTDSDLDALHGPGDLLAHVNARGAR